MMEASQQQVSGTPEANVRSFVFKNVGSSVVPAYGCMMMVDSSGNIGKGIGAESRSNRSVVYCKQPNQEAENRQDPGLMAFNSRHAVRPQEFGKCVIGGYPVKALGSPSSGESGLRIKKDSYSLESTDVASDAAFTCVGTPDSNSSLSYVVPSKSSTKIVGFTLTENLVPRGSADAFIVSEDDDNETPIIVNDWTGIGGVNGDNGIAWKDGDKYRVIEIKSGTPVRFRLEEDIDPVSHLAGASIILDDSDYEESIEVEDWAYNGGKEGDQGLAMRIGETYYIVEMHNQPQIVRFTLTEDLDLARESEAEADIEGLIVGDPKPGTVVNWTRKRARLGARGLAWEVYTGDETIYHIISIEAAASRVRGRVAADFNCSDATATLDSLHGMDGEVIEDEIEAVNYGLGGTEGDVARAEYNEIDEQWELVSVVVDAVTEVYVGGGTYGVPEGIYYKTMCNQTGILVVELIDTCP
jgi:hypothetical protein